MDITALSSQVVRFMEYFFHAHLLIALATYIVVAALLRKHLHHLRYRSISHEKVPFEKLNAPKISVIIPAHNEALGIVESVNAALSIDYPNYEIVVIDDGSSDQTLETLKEHFQLAEYSLTHCTNLSKSIPLSAFSSTTYPRLRVIQKTHTGKADSLNVGIQYSSGEYICCIDSDSIITPDALRKLIIQFINEPTLVALGGAIAPSNEIVIKNGEVRRKRNSQSIFVGVQIIEYLRSFTSWRTGWSYLDGLLIIGGALTIFNKEALIRIGGYRSEAYCEDLEIILSLHEYHLKNNLPYKIWTVPDVICWTRVPKDKVGLKKQRIRWMWGALQSLSWHKKLMFNRKSLLIGWFSFPHIVFIEAFAPVIELLGIVSLWVCIVLGLLSYTSFFIYGLLIYAISGFYSWYAIAVNDSYISSFNSLQQILRLGAIGLIEPIGYRQRDAYWRMIGWWRWLRGKPISW
ncbi:glycosyltransferase family 2 protein [Polynucleobacter sp. MWH-Braz-FAM2G]|uniref:glycosyltransferase family 2 protein n=1 Tax=Polynucleobacter sp. MWH-Braz-FAM2G TaxID=1855883 RepID=UPI001BFCED83|nr:glycosyltransferase [Polynucleobacter sp. MWH-Braz-FAM2G]QWD90230.1 glycosyltransferase family 2 protein [Polynucleobacter sp. MWH-Braz-FAM2G]